jgi:hypothetical protein
VREDGRIVGGERVAGKSKKQAGMEEAPENSEELSHSAHGSGMNK